MKHGRLIEKQILLICSCVQEAELIIAHSERIHIMV